MGGGLIAQYRRMLAESANSLNQGATSLPVDLDGLCRRLNVVIRREDIPRFRAYLTFDDLRGAHAAIVLSSSNNGKAYERFMIAHEIGHLILKRECGAVPMGTSEYWQHENLCDEFARAVLIPQRIIQDWLTRTPHDVVDLLLLSDQVRVAAGIHWLGSACRISDFKREVTFLRLRWQKDGRLRILGSGLPNKKEITRFAPKGGKFSSALKDLLFTFDGEQKTPVVELDASLLGESDIPSISKGRKGAVRRTPYDDIQLAVSTEMG